MTEVINKAKEVAEEVADKTEDVVEEVADKTEDVVEEVADKTEDAAEAVADKTEDAAEAVADKTEEVINEAKNITNEGVKEMAKNTKKVEVLEDDKEDDGKLRFKMGLKQAAKYALTSLVCFGGGVAAKIAFDNHKAKKAMASANSAPSEFVDAPYETETAPEPVTYTVDGVTITEF